MERLLRIGELAKAAGVSTRTIDFYTNRGLIQPADRTEAGYRLYDAAALELVAAIRHLEDHGMGLDEIKTALSATATRSDLSAAVSHLDTDLATLHNAAETASPQVQALLAVFMSRAHSLISTAVEIANASP